ncbi:MAG: type II toxin-antitoxin system PemK/MazF family toxin [Chloroflexi bacterium]|nr:type II toxin-antitoxin system PemK/MazF family toxin [Chloroflexota bacterium]
MAPRRGEIWQYEFRAPDKRRPVVVLSRPRSLSVLGTAIVAPVTSTIRGIPTEVVVGPEDGLRHISAVSLDNLQNIERRRLRQYIGTLSDAKMNDVCRALAVATGCD